MEDFEEGEPRREEEVVVGCSLQKIKRAERPQVHSMAKKSSKRRFNLRKVQITAAVAAGALAALDVQVAALSGAAVHTYRCMSAELIYNWLDIAAIIDDGCIFGLAHSDYSAAEIEECLEAQGSIDIGDKVAQEQANRLVRRIGTIAGSTGAAGSGNVYNLGQPVKTRLNWLIGIGDTISIWVRNSSGVVWTTGSSVGAVGHLWITQ